jgi:hypothetical protein
MAVDGAKSEVLARLIEDMRLIEGYAGVVQWQNDSFPSNNRFTKAP